MANVTGFQPYDYTADFVWFGAILEATSNLIVIDDGGRRAEYRGDFSYSIFGSVSGTLDSFREFQNGTLIHQVEGADADAGALYNAIQIQADAVRASQILLAGDDVAQLSDGRDVVNAYAGNDRIQGNGGDDVIEGGFGTDTAAYRGNKSDYNVVVSSSGVTVSDRREGRDGTDSLTNIETLSFADGDWNLEIFSGLSGLSEEALLDFIELYIAYFNRAPDAEGLFFYGTAFANGTSLEQSAATFLNSPEYQAAYPDGLSNREFTEAVYANVLGRQPDVEGIDFWVNVLDSGARTRDVFILEVLNGVKADAPTSATPEFIAQQALDASFLSNKTDIGAYFSVIKGMSNVESAANSLAAFAGTEASFNEAINSIDTFFDDATSADGGEFLLPLVGVIDSTIEFSG